MLSSLEKISAKFEFLQQTYKRELPKKIKEIQGAWEKFKVQPDHLESYLTLVRLVHKLAGSGTTFGFANLSEMARDLEVSLKSLMETDRPFKLAKIAEISQLITAIKKVANESDNITFGLEAKTHQVIDQNLQINNQISSDSSGYNRLIYLIEDDTELAQELALQISYFGYQVHIFEKLPKLEVEIQQNCPSAMIVDIVFPEGEMAGIKLIEEMKQYWEKPIPVLFISAKADFNTRLQAVRAGGLAYFTKPVELSSLIEKLDQLTAKNKAEPYRILLVEDDEMLGEYHALFLQQYGMITYLVKDPMFVMQPLMDFTPDLILMDMYMPGCSGLELAAVIRQQDVFVSIPIVFLSVETDVDKHLTAMNLGSDQFLTKPIDPEYLVAEVISRVRRSRILRSLMVRDSLTGLLNHTNIKEQLAMEVARAKRHNTPLAVAMIDIDRFKLVNDTYGHLTGDRVIKSLSRLLQQRLRKTDIIGRYGGEEFAVILPHTEGDTAVKILNELREGFAQVRQQSGQQEFVVTISVGIASFPNYKDPHTLSDAADKALYQAKRTGRNRVVISYESNW